MFSESEWSSQLFSEIVFRCDFFKNKTPAHIITWEFNLLPSSSHLSRSVLNLLLFPSTPSSMRIGNNSCSPGAKVAFTKSEGIFHNCVIWRVCVWMSGTYNNWLFFVNDHMISRFFSLRHIIRRSFWAVSTTLFDVNRSMILIMIFQVNVNQYKGEEGLKDVSILLRFSFVKSLLKYRYLTYFGKSVALIWFICLKLN